MPVRQRAHWGCATGSLQGGGAQCGEQGAGEKKSRDGGGPVMDGKSLKR